MVHSKQDGQHSRDDGAHHDQQDDQGDGDAEDLTLQQGFLIAAGALALDVALAHYGDTQRYVLGGALDDGDDRHGEFNHITTDEVDLDQGGVTVGVEQVGAPVEVAPDVARLGQRAEFGAEGGDAAIQLRCRRGRLGFHDDELLGWAGGGAQALSDQILGARELGVRFVVVGGDVTEPAGQVAGNQEQDAPDCDGSPRVERGAACDRFGGETGQHMALLVASGSRRARDIGVRSTGPTRRRRAAEARRQIGTIRTVCCRASRPRSVKCLTPRTRSWLARLRRARTAGTSSGRVMESRDRSRTLPDRDARGR